MRPAAARPRPTVPRPVLLRLAACLLVLMAAAPTAAQGDVRAGDRVRVTTGGQKLTFRFGEVRGDTLFLEGSDGVIVRLPVASVRRMEVGVPRGRGESVLRGAAWGTALGAGAGLLLGGMAGSDCGQDRREGSLGAGLCGLDTMSAYGGWGAALGAVAGSIAGALSRSWTWRPVPRSALSLRVSPAGAGVGLGFRW